MDDQKKIMRFMSEYACAYIGSGGPTSRLEEALFNLGKKLGYQAEIYATPTGVFLSTVGSSKSESGGSETQTSIHRIKESSIHLERLCWLEEVFENVFNQKISPVEGVKLLSAPRLVKSPYSPLQTIAAAFAAGFSLSFTSYHRIGAAIVCGLITVATWWVSGPGLKNRITSSIFRDFIGCATTLLLAAVCQVFFAAPFEAYTIGGIIVLVPGLTLTTAIAELADQNLVSGTAKLMQAMLTLLALGLAYILFSDLSAALGTATLGIVPLSSERVAVSFLESAFGIIISISCFSVLFKVPRKSLPFAAITGFLGWLIFRQFGKAENIVSASYFASLTVGLMSLFLASRFKVPSQVYSVPGILAMLPGMLALTSFNTFALGYGTSGLELGFRVAISSGSIVFGLFTARIPFALVKSTHMRFRQ